VITTTYSLALFPFLNYSTLVLFRPSYDFPPTPSHPFRVPFWTPRLYSSRSLLVRNFPLPAVVPLFSPFFLNVSLADPFFMRWTSSRMFVLLQTRASSDSIAGPLPLYKVPTLSHAEQERVKFLWPYYYAPCDLSFSLLTTLLIQDLVRLPLTYDLS